MEIDLVVNVQDDFTFPADGEFVITNMVDQDNKEWLPFGMHLSPILVGKRTKHESFHLDNDNYH